MAYIQHTPGFIDAPPLAKVREIEHLLSNWFGAEVILTSSGRAAILLYLTALGFDRYRHRIAVPRMISSCVLDAVIRRGFPIDAEGASSADGTILYHQYGFPQVEGGTGVVIEDICHSFFSTATSGSRSWWGEVAIFSLPKFFSLDGMGGGLVLVRSSRALQLRQMRDEVSSQRATKTGRQAQVLRPNGAPQDRSAVEQYYLSRLLDPRIFDYQTGGMPATLSEIRAVGETRQNVMRQLLEAVGEEALPTGWFGLLHDSLPFALPVFGDEAQLRELDAVFSDIGVSAGIYSIDVTRNMTRPRYRTALLLPCHHEVPDSKLNEMICILKSVSTKLGRLQ
jgi:hypothetical protein